MALHAAYFDDSGSHKQSDHFIIAGNISTVDRWHAFNEDWSIARDAHGLTWFHMVDAENGHGEFEAWPWPARKILIKQFAEYVAKYRQGAISVSIDYAAWRKLVAPVMNRYPVAAKVMGDPYTDVYALALYALRGWCDKFKVSPKDVEVFFAKQGKSEWPAQYTWGWLCEKLGFDEPHFREPRNILPLQGADMYAWRENRSKTHPDEPIESRHHPLFKRPYLRSEMSREILASVAQRLGNILSAVDWSDPRSNPPAFDRRPRPD